MILCMVAKLINGRWVCLIILLKNMMLQLFFALIPFVSFNIYYRDKLTNYSRSFITVTSSICLLVSMTFANSVVDGVIFDIRYVIVFFGLVFGGTFTGVVLLAEFVLYRLYLGGEGTWVGMLILLCVFFISLLLSRLYRTTTRQTLVTATAGCLFSLIPLALAYAFFPHYVTAHWIFHILAIPVQNLLGILLLMSLFSKSVSDKDMFIKHARNEKIEAMSHVAASLAHEVRNPLTAVKGFLTLMSRNPHDPHKTEQYIRISLDEIQRTESILSEYLAITKPFTERRERVDLSEQLQAVYNVMTPYATMYNVELILRDAEPEPAPGSFHVLANPDEIKQLLVNFVKNAVEACSDTHGGRVILKLKAEEKSVKLLIKDNGAGMSEEQIKRLGSIYFSTKSNGTGLGLTYSYQVIHAIGGQISVSSNPLAGTAFIITLPAAGKGESG
ncbi:Sporulation kinase E [Paenibacillus konkukensis]|uniref:histidine kinase n=2 Tax=Paenibacillus konkukensis TaxID=2020716 RepID=A0ABY4RID6_9BACL|nr:Sporulation kinase E [Paenibacillus konkukensis]